MLNTMCRDERKKGYLGGAGRREEKLDVGLVGAVGAGKDWTGLEKVR